MGKPDAPTPPDPIATARAATGTNVSTAVANAYLQNINQNTPNGSLSYNQTGNYDWRDPTTGSSYNIPTFTATQVLSPQGQAIQAQTQAAQYNMAGMANAQSERISGLLSSNLQTQGYGPLGGNAADFYNIPDAKTSYDIPGGMQSNLNLATSYGPSDNFSADRQRVEDSLMQRMNPQLQIQQQALQQQLSDQGIRYGSQAYSDAMFNNSQQQNDARWGAINQAGAEQQRMVQEAGAQAAFGNEAQTQMGTFANQAQAQAAGQAASQASFYNTGLAQNLQQTQSGFNAMQAQRNQWLQEQYAQRNQPINEITSLLSGSQVQQPNFVNTPGAQIPTTDVGSLINNQFNQQLGIYNQQSQNYNSVLGGVLGLGAGAIKASDERMKENINKMGDVLTSTPKGNNKTLPFYEYSYKDDPVSVRHVGPMAQDVEKIDPKAVQEKSGRKYIDQRRVLGGILKA